MAPAAGVTADNVAVGTTVNATPLLSKPFTRTTTGPDVAPAGTLAAMVD